VINPIKRIWLTKKIYDKGSATKVDSHGIDKLKRVNIGMDIDGTKINL
jgi:hypothetical protein